MFTWFQKSIRNKFMLLLACIIIIPSVAIGWYSEQSARSNISKEIVNNASYDVQLLNNTINQMINSKLQDVKLLAMNVDASNEDTWQNLKQYSIIHPEIQSCFVGTQDGKFYINTDAAIPQGFDPRTRDWYLQANRNKNQPIITSPYVGSDGILIISIAQKTQDGSGVVAINLSLQELSSAMNKVHIGENGYIYIVDQEKKYIYHPAAKIGSLVPKGPLLDYLFQHKSGQFQDVLQKKSNEDVFITNSLTGWKIAGSFLKSDINDAVFPIIKSTVYVSILAIVLAMILSFYLLNKMIRPISQLISVSERVRAGILTDTITNHSKDELGLLVNSFNSMLETLRNIIFQVGQSSDHLAASSEELLASTEQTAQAAEHISSTMQELAIEADQQATYSNEGSIEITRVYGDVQQINDNVEHVSMVAQHSTTLSNEGHASILTAISQMEEINKAVFDSSIAVRSLGEQTNSISEIVNIITEISSQTNLLALNAAIEAARAGEYGRGFAVVAEEVRKLAVQSEQSAGKIGKFTNRIHTETEKTLSLIENSLQAVKLGIEVVQKAGVSFNEIQISIQEVDRQIEEITGAIQNMNTSTEKAVNQIIAISEIAENNSSGVQTVSAATQEQLASMEEVTASAQNLSKLAEELQHMISLYSI